MKAIKDIIEQALLELGQEIGFGPAFGDQEDDLPPIPIPTVKPKRERRTVCHCGAAAYGKAEVCFDHLYKK